jgi:hypothetical protein
MIFKKKDMTMKLKSAFAFLTLAVVVAGCQTPYLRSDQTIAGGYDETQLGENVFKVHFQGNGYTKPQRAEDFALLRSAELALENGFKFFMITNGNTYVSTDVSTTPLTAHTRTSGYISGNNLSAKSRTTFSGGDIFVDEKPSTTNTIVCFVDKPTNTNINGIVYDAAFIRRSLRAKYPDIDQK